MTPFGELVATPARGAFIGNRGIIHDPATRTLTGRGWTTKSWIVCTCDFKDRNRSPIWTRRSWTELFFLDEATALAAGHRPCFECRRAAAQAFAEAWAAGNGTALPRAAEMDAALHRERLEGRRKRRHALLRKTTDLPDGTMLASGTTALLVYQKGLWFWSHDGYRPAPDVEPPLELLTPPSTLATLEAGYRAATHLG